MGMAASQARLLSITARIHDVEYQAQAIQNQKLQLAMLEDQAYKKYNDALDATTLTFNNDAMEPVVANFNNLCGKASINNGMSKNYVFRTGDFDRLIVPDDIFIGFEKFEEAGGSDAYAFAMFMLGVDPNELEAAQTKYMEEVPNSTNDGKDAMRDIVRQIAKLAGVDPDEAVRNIIDGFDKEISGRESIDQLLPDSDNEHYDEIKDLITKFKEEEQKYLNKIYRNNADRIFDYATGGREFDEDEYNYYLRWGMLIDEVGLNRCVSSADYGEDFNTNSDMLNNMLQSGRITVDTVEFNKDGTIKDEATSVAADSRLAYTTTSTIDKKAVAKAEAEYEHTLKEIDRKDKRFDMDLNKLETERTALTTEYDSVKKVIKDNVERTFGIFS